MSGSDVNFDEVDAVPPAPLLGDILIGQRMIERDVFEDAMRDYSPARHGRIGDYLVDQEVISRSAIEQALELQRQSYVERKLSVS